MNKKWIVSLMLLVALSPVAFAKLGSVEGEATPPAAADTLGAAVDAGNKMCPISGEAVNPEVSYTYNGKIYHFCCAACIEKFKADPETYVAKLAQEGNG